MLTKLPAQNKIAAFDIDAQNTFTPVCPDEPVSYTHLTLPTICSV